MLLTALNQQISSVFNFCLAQFNIIQHKVNKNKKDSTFNQLEQGSITSLFYFRKHQKHISRNIKYLQIDVAKSAFLLIQWLPIWIIKKDDTVMGFDNDYAMLQCTISTNSVAFTMPVITERELTDYLHVTAETGVKKRGIDAFIIEEHEPGVFKLVLDLTFKGRDMVLITTRKTPRLWPKLNSAVTFIKSLGFPDAPITLKLLREPNEGKSSSDQKDGA